METNSKKTPRRDLLVELGLENSTVFENPDYDSAIIGYNDDDSRIIYDFEKMAKCLMEEDGMTYEEAVDFIDYNTIRALPYFPKAPIILHSIEDYLDYDNATITDYNFDVKKTTKDLIQWIRDWFEENGKGCNAVVALSGGKDSTIVAALCAEALGKDRVIGVAMPDKGQDVNDADKIAEYLGIKYMKCDISSITDAIHGVWTDEDDVCALSNQAEQNIPPRVRMTMAYSIAQTYNGRVVGTCNKSENYVGYFTRYGDGASDIEPLGNLTCRQVVAIGDYLGLPKEWVHKTPDDGLPNSIPDNEKFARWGFSYKTLDDYIEYGTCGNEEIDIAIKKKHKETMFKMFLGTIFKK